MKILSSQYFRGFILRNVAFVVSFHHYFVEKRKRKIKYKSRSLIYSIIHDNIKIRSRNVGGINNGTSKRSELRAT